MQVSRQTGKHHGWKQFNLHSLMLQCLLKQGFLCSKQPITMVNILHLYDCKYFVCLHKVCKPTAECHSMSIAHSRVHLCVLCASKIVNVLAGSIYNLLCTMYTQSCMFYLLNNVGMNYNGCVHVGLTKLRQIMQYLIPSSWFLQHTNYKKLYYKIWERAEEKTIDSPTSVCGFIRLTNYQDVRVTSTIDLSQLEVCVSLTSVKQPFRIASFCSVLCRFLLARSLSYSSTPAMQHYTCSKHATPAINRFLGQPFKVVIPFSL